MDTIGGIPAHPLLVHIPVVLIPLAVVGVLLCLWPRFRGALFIPTVVITVIGAFGAAFAANSGDSLEERVPESPALHDHKDLGEMARNFALLMMLLVIAAFVVWLLSRREGSAAVLPKVVTGLLALSLVVGCVATWYVVDAGHAGAKITWNRALKNAPPAGSGGEGGEGGG